MRIHIDATFGAAGDMLFGALLDCHPDPAAFLEQFNRLGIPGAVVSAAKTQQCGITGTQVSVEIHGQHEHVGCDDHIAPPSHDDHHHHHHGYGVHDIEHLLSHLDIPAHVRETVTAIYQSIAEAESEVHGKPVDHIHFHELGSADALCDILGVSLLLDALQPQTVTCSPICVGAGTVTCAHGVLPVPAPATALLLRGVPTFALPCAALGAPDATSTALPGELTTPTGAALLKHFAAEFIAQPLMTTDKVGVGFGTKTFPNRPNLLRVMTESKAYKAQENRMLELVANLDDMTGEEIGFAMERLFDAGAVDVWWTQIGGKKSRPAVMLTALAPLDAKAAVADTFLRHTTTWGVRFREVERIVMERTIDDTAPILRKVGKLGDIEKSKPEFASVAEICGRR